MPSKSYNLMSYGIPALYIAAPDSELKSYAERFGHAVCYSESELDLASAFIRKLSNDVQLYQKMSEKSLAAAASFKRENAGKFVASYLNRELC